jgi:membrane-bound inhibitor of C-type lysozyme
MKTKSKVTSLTKSQALLVLLVTLVAVAVGLSYMGQKITKKQNTTDDKNNLGTLVNSVSYKCDNKKTIQASFYQGIAPTPGPEEMPKPAGSVKLTLSDGRELTLPQTLSGSGIRYANADESIVFWSKGDTAFITENNTETYSNCIVSSD